MIVGVVIGAIPRLRPRRGTAWCISRSLSAAAALLSLAAFPIAVSEVSSPGALTIGSFFVWSALSLVCALTAWKRTTNPSGAHDPHYTKAITVGMTAIILAFLEIVAAGLAATA